MGEALFSRLDEATHKLLEGAEAALDELCQRVEKHLFREETRRRFRRYLIGLLHPIERRNGWQMAEQMGESSPDGTQRFMRTASWSAGELRDDLREYVHDSLETPEGVLIVDETGFLKQGNQSVGVKRQYSGTAGKVENCQVGVFLCYASSKGAAFIDRELYLPAEWAEDRERRETAGVPKEVTFATKPQLARRMLTRAFDGGVDARWVAADSVYGSDRAFRSDLEARKQRYVLAVRSDEPVWVNRGRGPVRETVSTMAAALPAQAWQRRSAGEGSKGPRWSDWAWVPVDGDPEEPCRDGPLEEPEWEWGLLVRRSLEDPSDLAYFLVFAQSETSMEEIVWAAGRRWSIESSLETAKGEVGLDQYEVRTWTAWYRYITMALLAHAFLSVLRAQVNPSFPVSFPEPLLDEPVPDAELVEDPGVGVLQEPDKKGGAVSDREPGPEALETKRLRAALRRRDPPPSQPGRLESVPPHRVYLAVVPLASAPPSTSPLFPLPTSSSPPPRLTAAVVLCLASPI